MRAASTLAGRIVRAFGDGQVFWSPNVLASAPLEECGITSARATTIRALASSDLEWEGVGNSESFLERLRALRGIGSWTAQYIAMRALGEPDAFPAGDLILQRAAGCRSARELEARAEAWRPWRAYAVIQLWQGVNDDASV